ncbi:MAG: hypothetical protein WBG46_02085 [Nonlabens sp.]
MKKILLLLLCSAAIYSCDTDDDLPELPEPVFNSFCYGTDAEEQLVAGAFNLEPEIIQARVYKTSVFIIDDNFSVPMDELEGAGFLISLDLYGNEDFVLQPGNYLITDDESVASAQVAYSTNFDTDEVLNTSLSLESGRVIVRISGPGFYIQIDGVDANGNPFHGNYFGRTTTLL